MTIYERADAPGQIWMERAWVTTEKGNPIPEPFSEGPTWEAAELIAEGSDSAILSVEVRDAETRERCEVERMFLHFRPEFDKRKRDQWVPVSEKTRRLIEDALARPIVVDSGWLIPEGQLDYENPWDKLHDAERVLGIPTVHARAYHGIKRQHITRSDEVAHGDLSLVGDVTRNRSKEVLGRIYRFPQLGRMVSPRSTARRHEKWT